MSLTKDIESLLPHRKPFLFVDEIISAESLRRCADVYTYRSNLKNPLVSKAINLAKYRGAPRRNGAVCFPSFGS